MSAHAKVFINMQHTGDTSLNNWMPDAVKEVNKWLFEQGFDVNEIGQGQAQSGKWKAREYHWIEMESTSCAYEIFNEDYVAAVMNTWVAKFPQLTFEYSAYNLDIEPDVFITAGGAA